MLLRIQPKIRPPTTQLRNKSKPIEATAVLLAVLERSRSVGFLGRGPVASHIEHAELFGRALGSAECRYGDIGAGGGVPSLPLLIDRPWLQAVLIDSSQKRCSFLVWAVAELDLDSRVEVWCGRAEEIGREERARGHLDAVVARGFGPPATTLECAAPLLRPNGRVIVSEPPVSRRWPTEGLGKLGLEQVPSDDGVAVFERTGELRDGLPRTSKQQSSNPLFELD